MPPHEAIRQRAARNVMTKLAANYRTELDRERKLIADRQVRDGDGHWEARYRAGLKLDMARRIAEALDG